MALRWSVVLIRTRVTARDSLTFDSLGSIQIWQFEKF